MNVTNGSLPPPSPPDLEQIVLKELVGRQWIGWCIASVLLLGSACFVAHGCWVQCCSNYAVLRAWLSGRNSKTATKGAVGLPAQAMRPRCHRCPIHSPSARQPPCSSHPHPLSALNLSLPTAFRTFKVSALPHPGSSKDGTASTRQTTRTAARPPRLPRRRCRWLSLCLPTHHRGVPPCCRRVRSGPSWWLLLGIKSLVRWPI